MAEIKSFPNNQDVYVGAELVMKWLHGRTSGVFGAENNLATAVVPDSMSVEISDGVGWMSNSNGDGIVFWNDSEQTSGSKMKLTHDVADGVMDRIDRIVVTWETTNYVALPSISILKGTASSSPTAPALTNNSTQRQISLVRVRIPAGTVSLSASMITDERLDPSVCGIVTERVSVDTSVINSKVNAVLEDVEDQSESVLSAIQNELANIVGGTGFDPAPVRFENVSVTPEYFEMFSASDDEESKLIEMGFEYRASVPISGVIETMFPYLTFSLFDLEESGIGIANQLRCYNGGVYLYSDGLPESNINILTAEFRKAVS